MRIFSRKKFVITLVLAVLLLGAAFVSLFFQFTSKPMPNVSAPIKELAVSSGNKDYTVDLVVSYDDNAFLFLLYNRKDTEKKRLLDSYQIIAPFGNLETATSLLEQATDNYAEVYSLSTTPEDSADVFCFRQPRALDEAGTIYGYLTDFCTITPKGKIVQYGTPINAENPDVLFYDYYTSDKLVLLENGVLSDPYGNYQRLSPQYADTGCKFEFDEENYTITPTRLNAGEQERTQELSASIENKLVATTKNILLNYHEISLDISELDENEFNLSFPVEYDNQKIAADFYFPPAWEINAAVFNDANGNKVGEIAPAVINKGKLPAETYLRSMLPKCTKSICLINIPLQVPIQTPYKTTLQPIIPFMITAVLKAMITSSIRGSMRLY